MKKNVMMRLASFLLVAVLISTTAISGTYAKYVTSDNASDEARVAHWGVQITSDGTLFEQTYATDDTATYTGPNSVVSSDAWDIVAPGTTGEVTTIALSGTPEVAYKVEFTPVITLANWEAYSDEYCPIVFTVDGKTYGIADDCGVVVDYDCADVDELITKVQDAIKDSYGVYGPGESLTAAKKPVINWAWPFETGNDNKDTYLGQVAAGVLTGSAATIEIDMTITVTQVN